MRVAPLLAGVVAVLLGVVLIALTFVSSPVVIPASGFAPVTAHPLSSGTMTVSWSGAPSGYAVGVYHCSSQCTFTSMSQCSGLPCTSAGGPIATGHGTSGSVTFAVDSSSTYDLVAQGSSLPIAASASLSGLTLLMLLGVILAILGVVLFVLARGGGTKSPSAMGSAEGAEEESPAEEEDDGVRWEAPVAPPPVVVAAPPKPAQPPARTAYVAPPPPPRDEPEEEEAAPAAPFKARPPIICAKCGATNEPWLTQCRNCKRPLTSTAAL
ncbi:MAG: hypothetical protein L3J87_04075 [Thermoplasmata archaeon]|nr:hypothetical protein [Thermoplasmata archaeon]